jgi:hypothetical protein
MHREARGVWRHPAERGVINRGGAARREADAERARRWASIITAREEAAGSHEAIGDPEDGDDAVEEGAHGYAAPAQVEDRDEDAPEQAAISRAADVEEGVDRAPRDGVGHGAQDLEDIAAEERGDIAVEERAALDPLVGAVAADELEKCGGAD